MRFFLQPTGSYTLIAIIMVILVGLLVAGLLLTRASWSRRFALVGLRGGAIAVLLWVLLQPSLVHTTLKKHSATLVILADRSRSMQVTDAAGSRSRWQELVESVQRSLPQLAALEQDLEIKVYTFDSEVAAVDRTNGEFKLPDEPLGEQSAIGKALDEVLRLEANKRLVGVVLMSDGAQRALPDNDLPPQVPASQLADMGVPLFCIAFGEARGLGQARDLALTELTVSPTVFVKNELPVSGSLRVDGFVNKPLKVELEWEIGKDMKVVNNQTLTATEDGAQLKLALSHVPEVPGEHKLTVRVAPQLGERITSNNELSTFVTVLKGGINVLYLEGRPRSEQKFLRWSLGSSPNIHIEYHEVDATAEPALPPEATEWFKPGKFDVYMIGDLDSRAFDDELHLKPLRKCVENGAGLIMLGGFNSFGPGGYQWTSLYLNKDRKSNNEYGFEIRSVLPITMDRTERQSLAADIVSDLHLQGEQKIRPSRQGQRHYLMQLGDAATNDQVWAKLPPMQGANRFRGLTGLSVPLAENQDGDDLLVAHEFGKGRVIAFACDETWRWWMHGFQKEHRRFWRQIVLYLAHKDQADDAGVWVKLPRRRYLSGQRVDIIAGAQTPEGEPVTDTTFTGEVILPNGQRRPFALHRQTVDFTGSFLETSQPGDYTIEVKTARSELGTARARFLVHKTDLELDNPAADPGLLSSLASVSSGKLLAPEQLKGALEDLGKQDLNLEVETEQKTDLWDNAWVLLLFVSLLSVEWFLRKRWGLV